MNVAIFTDNDFEKVNGVTTVLRAALVHAPADIRLRIYTCDSAGVNRPDYLAFKSPGVGIPYYGEMKMYVPPVNRFLRQARADRIDLIHLTTPGPVGLAALRVAGQLGVPLVGSFHTHLAEYTRRLSGSAQLGTLMREYMRWMYGKCERVLAPSEATREVLVASRVRSEKIRIWRRGVSTTQFTPTKRWNALRAQWGASADRPAILYVGRLSAEKGLADLSVMHRALNEASLPHRLIVVGDGPMRAQLEAACPEAIFTGSLSHEEVAVAMASADVFVFPSRTDTAGNVVLEAQASGLPVLVTDEGGPQENLHPGQSGVVCRTTDNFIEQLQRLIMDRGARERLSRQARTYALSRSWEAALADLYDTYRTVGARVQVHRVVRDAGLMSSSGSVVGRGHGARSHL